MNSYPLSNKSATLVHRIEYDILVADLLFQVRLNVFNILTQYGTNYSTSTAGISVTSPKVSIQASKRSSKIAAAPIPRYL